jgi:AAA15 family ATPase/GTPase
MLIDFTVGNFRSFGEKQTLSMIASNDPLMASHVISDERLLKRKKIKLLRNVVIYGANASGKSNLCAAVRCMSWLVAFSATKLNFGDEIPNMVPFRLKSEFE